MMPHVPDIWRMITLHLLVAVILLLDRPLSSVNAQKSSKDYNHPSYQSEYGSDYESEQNRIACYQCSITKIGAITTGVRRCVDPFLSVNIPEKMCSGSCVKQMFYIGPNRTDYTLVRDCVEECTEQDTPHGTVECCKKNRCNGVISSYIVHPVTYYSCFTLAIISFVHDRFYYSNP